MRASITLILTLFFCGLIAQREVSVYAHDGSKIVGVIELRDSLSGILKVKIQGGTVIALRFNTIDSILSSNPRRLLNIARPIFGFGLGVAMNSNVTQLQFDMQMGYQINRKFQGGLGFCSSTFLASYLDLHYFHFHKKQFAAGAYVEPGLIMKRLFDTWYYYNNTKVSGFYSNTGLCAKFYSSKSREFYLQLGYQFIQQKETYINWNQEKTTNLAQLNRYILQGIYTF